MRKAFVALLVAVGCVFAQNVYALSPFISTHRPVAVLTPHIGDMLANGMSAEEIAQHLSSYDIVMGGRSVVNLQYGAILRRIKEIQSRATIGFMQGVWYEDCARLATEPQRMVDDLRKLGRLHGVISFIELDGAGNASVSCSSPAFDVDKAVRSYRPKLDGAGYFRIPLIVNSGKYGSAVPQCNYDPLRDSRGFYMPNVQDFSIGRIQEQISRFFDPKKKNILEGIMADFCAWSVMPRGPHFSIAYGKCDTPWWNERGLPATWSCARLSFVLSQMFPSIAFIMSPADTDTFGELSYSHTYWLDEFAISKATNAPPAYGPNPLVPKGADHAGRRAARGFLHRCDKPAWRSGDLLVLDCECGYMVANIGDVPLPFTPLERTQHFKGVQDPLFNDDSSHVSYLIPKHDGKLLIKRNRNACMERLNRQPVQKTMWVPHN